MPVQNSLSPDWYMHNGVQAQYERSIRWIERKITGAGLETGGPSRFGNRPLRGNLTRRPFKMTPTDDVDVQMVYRLTAMLAGVHDGAKTMVQFLGFGDFANLHKKASKNLGIFHFSYIGNMIFGQNQYMCRALWINISDCDARLIFSDNI
jgi:hypothetical protein